MGNICCPISPNHIPEDTGVLQSLSPSDEQNRSQISEAEKEARRKLQADAAMARSKEFKNGGGGEKLKSKSKALEEYEKKNREIGGKDLDWN